MAVNKIFIPTFISSVDYQPVRTLPHIYFYNGLKECEPYYIEHYTNTTGSVTASVQNSFPYVDNYDGLIPTTGSRSLLFYNESTPYGDTPTASLYTTYWDKYVSLLYNPKTRLINCSAIIPLADYFEMELNDIVQWRGNYYHLRAINDYNLKNGTCNLQLLGPIISDAVTPETFDCTFTFNSIVENPTPTTSTTTVAPTTSTTTLTPTTSTTTLAPTTSTTTLTPTYTIEFLTVGGGGGSSRNGGGGGGAGGFNSQSISVTQANSYTISVGAGGAGSAVTFGSNGGNSRLFPGGATSYGGGGGGGGLTGTGPNGQNGASGGGPHRTGTIGLAIYSGQGKRGGTGVAAGDSNGGGGGGHSAIGGDSSANGNTGGNGGAGTAWLNGITYAGGGGGGAENAGIGGTGGGGNGGSGAFSTGMQSGVANTGGGGGGRGPGDNNPGANGGSGIVIIRYLGTPRATGGNVTQGGGYTYHTFTSSGTFVA